MKNTAGRKARDEGPKGGAGSVSAWRERRFMECSRQGGKWQYEKVFQSIGCRRHAGANTLKFFSFKGTMETVTALPWLVFFALFLKYLIRKKGCAMWVGSVSTLPSLAQLICVFSRFTRWYRVPNQTNDIWEEQKGEAVKNSSPCPSIVQRLQVFKSQAWKNRTHVSDFL